MCQLIHFINTKKITRLETPRQTWQNITTKLAPRHPARWRFGSDRSVCLLRRCDVCYHGLVTYFLPPALERIKNTYCMDQRPFLHLYSEISKKIINWMFRRAVFRCDHAALSVRRILGECAGGMWCWDVAMNNQYSTPTTTGHNWPTDRTRQDRTADGTNRPATGPFSSLVFTHVMCRAQLTTCHL